MRCRPLNAVVLGGVISALLVAPGCGRSDRVTVTLAGSTAFQPFAEQLAERYMGTQPGVLVQVQGGGSAVGIQAALSGTADIGMADLLELPAEAASLASTIVARDGIAIVNHPRNPLKALTTAQAHDVFTGRVRNWRELGGPEGAIRVISREEGSGTRRSFDALILGGDPLAGGALFQNSNGTVREAVASDPLAIGYVSIGLVNDKVQPLALDGIAPRNENVRAGTYRLARPVYFLTKGQPAPHVKSFIDYVLSPEAQGILENEGLIRAG